MDQSYQRPSKAWPVEKQQLLIDSMINGFDVPKIYMRKFAPPLRIDGEWYDFAMIDGKQRLKAIIDFRHGTFPLADDFIFMSYPEDRVAGKYYHELARFPYVVHAFRSFKLDIVEIKTNDLNSIEELFARLDGNTNSYDGASKEPQHEEALTA